MNLRFAFLALLAATAAMTATSAYAAPHTQTGPIFRGNGGETLPPFSVSAPSTLFWTNNGDIFQIFPSGSGSAGSVNAQSSKGWTYLPNGRYLLQINAVGDWTVKVVAGIVRPQRAKNGWLEYVGNGGMELPPFSAPRSETLYWAATGDIFQIFSGGFTGVEVNSQAHKGSTYMKRGVQQLQINTTGSWVILWQP